MRIERTCDYVARLARNVMLRYSVLNSDLWCDKIKNSAYLSKIIYDIVPALSSNDTDVAYLSTSHGEYIANDVYNMFDKIEAYNASVAISGSPSHGYACFQIDFKQPIMLNSVKIITGGITSGTSNIPTFVFNVQYKNSSNEWVNIGESMSRWLSATTDASTFTRSLSKFIRTSSLRIYGELVNMSNIYRTSAIYEWYIYGRYAN